MKTDKKEPYSADECLQKVKEMIRDLQYGNVILIIQDGKIIQIEKTEKIRL